MLDPAHDLNFQEVECAETLHAGDINSDLAWIGSALMMGMDATGLAEVVPGCARVKLIERQTIFTLDEFDVLEVC